MISTAHKPDSCGLDSPADDKDQPPPISRMQGPDTPASDKGWPLWGVSVIYPHPIPYGS
jgi:hypothetical protein